MTRARSQREAGAPLAAGRAARALPRAGSEGRLEREGGGGGGGGGGPRGPPAGRPRGPGRPAPPGGRRARARGGAGGGGGGRCALCLPADGRSGRRHSRVARAGGRAASHLAAHVQEQVDRQQHQHLRGSAGLF